MATPSTSSVTVGGNSPTIVPRTCEDAVGERQHLFELQRDERSRGPRHAPPPAGDEHIRSHRRRGHASAVRRSAHAGCDRSRARGSLSVGCLPRAGRPPFGPPPRTSNSPISVRAFSIIRSGNSQPKRRYGASRKSCKATFSRNREVEHEPATLAVLGNVTHARVEVARALFPVTSPPPASTGRPRQQARERASISSDWPFPSTPAIATSSPRATSNDTPRTVRSPGRPSRGHPRTRSMPSPLEPPPLAAGARRDPPAGARALPRSRPP